MEDEPSFTIGTLQDGGGQHVQVERADRAAGTGRARTLAIKQDKRAIGTEARSETSAPYHHWW